jgi:hypothetical protein
LHSLSNNRLRSLLSTIGIIAGIAQTAEVPSFHCERGLSIANPGHLAQPH